MHEHHLPVRRTARYFTLGHENTAVSEVWIVCHGYGQLARSFLKRFLPIDDPRRLIVAPEGLSRFYLGSTGGVHGPDTKIGATWMTREDRLSDIDDYVAYLDDLHDEVMSSRPGVRLVVLGFSQGVATVSRWLTHGKARGHQVILWGSGIPHEIRPDGKPIFHGAPITIVAGATDKYVGTEQVQAERKRLDELGIACRFISYDGGHDIDAPTLARLAAEGGV